MKKTKIFTLTILALLAVSLICTCLDLGIKPVSALSQQLYFNTATQSMTIDGGSHTVGQLTPSYFAGAGRTEGEGYTGNNNMYVSIGIVRSGSLITVKSNQLVGALAPSSSSVFFVNITMPTTAVLSTDRIAIWFNTKQDSSMWVTTDTIGTAGNIAGVWYLTASMSSSEVIPYGGAHRAIIISAASSMVTYISTPTPQAAVTVLNNEVTCSVAMYDNDASVWYNGTDTWNIDIGHNVTLYATPSAGFQFWLWGVNENPYSYSQVFSIVLSLDTYTFHALFVEAEPDKSTVSASVTPANMGTITMTSGAQTWTGTHIAVQLDAGDTVTLTATANVWKVFERWTVDGITYATTPTMSFVLTSESHTFVAYFSDDGPMPSGETRETLTNSMTFIVTYLVPFVVILAPALILAMYVGLAGFFGGAVIGLGIGITAGWIPVWFIILLGLALVAMMYFRGKEGE